MSEYVKSTNFASKDSLSVGNPLKIVKGTEIDSEFNNIATAVATKADIASPTFTGTPAAPTATAGTNTTQVATTAFVGTAVSNAVNAYDAALTVSTSQIENNAVTNSKLSVSAAIDNLGFTPVQQGGGSGQLTNKVYIGWTGSQLKGQVDAVDQGAFVMQPSFTGSNQSLGGNGSTGYQKLPGGLIMQWGYSGDTGSTMTINLPVTFPNAFINVQITVTSTSVSAAGASISSTSQFSVTRDTGNPISGFYWVAIGY